VQECFKFLHSFHFDLFDSVLLVVHREEVEQVGCFRGDDVAALVADDDECQHCRSNHLDDDVLAYLIVVLVFEVHELGELGDVLQDGLVLGSAFIFLRQLDECCVSCQFKRGLFGLLPEGH